MLSGTVPTRNLRVDHGLHAPAHLALVAGGGFAYPNSPKRVRAAKGFMVTDDKISGALRELQAIRAEVQPETRERAA